MADYYINSDKGKEIAGSMKAGDVRDVSDGSTWIKNSDGSFTIWKNGQKMNGQVGVSPSADSSNSSAANSGSSNSDATTSESSSRSPLYPSAESVFGQQQETQTQKPSASEIAKNATNAVTEGLYTIGTELGMSYIDQLKNAGDTKLLSDGYTLRREADGSYSASKGGSSAKVYIDNDAVKRDTLLNEAIRGASGQSNPYMVGTAKGYELLQQAKDTGSSVWAPDNSEWSYDSENGGFYTNRNGVRTPITVNKDAINREYATQRREEQSAQKEATDNVAPPEQADGEKYVIGSAEGVYWADNAKPGDMLGGRDDSLWIFNGYNDVTVKKNGKTYKATIDREAAKRDPQWAILTAPPVEEEEESGKKSKKKSSGTSSSSGSSGSLNTYFSGGSTGAKKETTQAASSSTGGDVASLRKKAASAQKDMADIARQIAAKKAQGKTDTAALEAKYAEAKGRYDSAMSQINGGEATLVRRATAPEVKAAAASGVTAREVYDTVLAPAPERASVLREYQSRTEARQAEEAAARAAQTEGPTLLEAATSAPEKQAAVRKAVQRESWRDLPTVADADRFSVNKVSDAAARKEAQKNAWRSLPTVQDSGRFNIPSQTDSLMQQAIAKTPRTLSGKPYLPENDGGFSHSSGSTERQNVLERIGNAALGGLIQSGGTSMDAAGAMYQAGQGGRNTTYDESRAWFQDQLDSELRTLNSMLLENQDNPGTYTQAEIKNQRRIVAEAQARVNAFALTQDAQEQSGELARDLAADVSNAGASRVAQSKRGASKLGSMALDALASAAQSGADMATNALLGTSGSMLPFAFRAFGGGTQQARNDGATLDQQLAYGGTMAAKEVFTEKMFNIAGLQSKAYGKGSFDDYVEKAVAGAVDKLASTDVGKRLLGGAAQFMTSAAGEGLEELIGDWMEWQLPRIYGKDPDSAKDVAVNSLYDFLVGAISGVMGNLTTPGQFTNYDVNEHLGGSQGQQVNRQLTQDELLDAAMQAANRGETLTGPVQAANQTTQQTTQGTQERSAEGVITGSETSQRAPTQDDLLNSAIQAALRGETLTEPLQSMKQNTRQMTQDIAESGLRSGASNQPGRSERSTLDQAILAAITGKDVRTIDQMGTNNAYASAEENAAARSYTHERVSNAEQFARANGRILTDADGNVSNYAGQVQELLAADHWNNTDRDVAATLRHEAFQRGDMDSFYRLSDRITETNTEAGRTLQGTQKWLEQAHPEQSVVAAAKKALDTNSKAPSGKMAFIEKTAREISGFGDNVSQWAGALKQIAEERRMTGVDMLVRMAEKQGENDPQWLKSLVYNGLYNVAGDYEKPTGAVDTVNKGLRRLKSYVITNQLFRVTTNAANVVSNSISNVTEAAAANTGTAHLADVIMSQFTGLRSHGTLENVLGKEALTTGKNFAQKSFVEIWLDTSTEGTDSKFQSSKGRVVREYKMTGNQLFSTIDAVLSTALNTTDAFATGVSQGAAQSALRRNVQKGYLTAEQALDVAEQRGSDTTFHNKTAIGTTLQRVQAAMNGGLEYGAGNIVAGNYLNVPAAVLMREVSKMPTVGTVGALIDMAAVCIDGKTGKNTIGDLQAKITGEKLTLAQRQSRAAQQLGRSLALGTMEVAGYTALALKGIIRRVDDDDKDKAAFEAAGGQQGLYINWSALWRSVPGGDSEWQDGDVITNLGRLEPLTVNMNFGIDVAEALKTDEGLRTEDLKNISISAVQDGIADLSMIQNIQGIMNALQYRSEDQSAFQAVGQELLASNVASLTPGLIQQAAKAIDPYYRDLYTGDTSGQQIYDIWANTIPGLRQQLPEKLTGFGTPKEYAGTGTERAVNALLNPYATTTVRPKTGMESMLQEAEDVSVYPNRNPIGSVGVNGQTVTLTNEQKRQYQTVYGQTYRDTLQALQGSIAFRQLDRRTKDAAMKAAESYAGTAAKTALDIGYKPPEGYAERAEMDSTALADALILEAVKSQKYLSTEIQAAKSAVENQYSGAAYARQSLDIVKVAKEKATAYFEHVEQAKYGGELTDAEQELSGKDAEYIADYFMRKAIDSYKNADGTSGHLSGDNATKYAAVAKKLDGPTFAGVGISGDILTEAKEKAHSFYTEVEKTGFGGILSADNRALNRKFAKMSDDEIAQYFLSIAAKEKFKDTNGNGTNLDETAAALKSGDINDATVFMVLDDDTVENYTRYGKSSSITPEILLQAARAKQTVKQDTDQDSVVVNTSQEQFEDWVNRQSWTQQQKQDVMKVFYPNTAEKKNYLVESLNSGKMKYTDAKKELTPTLQAGWTHQLLPTLDANANDTTKGALMSHYIEAAAAYDDRPNAAERKALNYSYAWQWFCDYLNTTDMTREQKYQIALILSGTDSQKTKDKIWSRLR